MVDLKRRISDAARALVPDLEGWPRWSLPAVACVAFIAHAGLLFLYNDFIYDDLYAIINNPLVTGDPGPCGEGIGDLATCDFWGERLDSGLSHQSWRPLTTLTYRLQWQLLGARIPTHFMLINISLHSVCSVLVTLIAHKLLLLANVSTAEKSEKKTRIYIDPYLLGKLSRERRTMLALTSGLLFAVHPVHCDAIATIVGRAELLYATFYFVGVTLCLHLWLLIAVNHPNHTFKKRPLLKHKSAAVFVLGLITLFATLSKEQGVTLMMSCACALSIFSERSNETKFSSAKRGAARKFMGAAAAITLAIAAFRLNFRGAAPFIPNTSSPFMQTTSTPHNPTSSSIFVQVLTKPYLWARHAFLIAWPMGPLCLDLQTESVASVTSVADIRLAYFPAVVIALVAIVNMLSKHSSDTFANVSHNGRSTRSNLGRFSLVAMIALGIVPFFPASGLIFQVGYMIAERVLYVPSAGLCVLAPLIADVAFLQDPATSSKKSGNKRYKASCGAILVLFALRTVVRCYDFRTSEHLYRAEVQNSPRNTKMLRNLAMMSGSCDEGATMLQNALKIRETDPHTHTTLASHYSEKCSNIEKAKLHADRAIELIKEYPNPLMEHIILYNGALIYSAVPNLEKSLELVQHAIDLFKFEARYYVLHAEILVEMGDVRGAVHALGQAGDVLGPNAVILDKLLFVHEKYTENLPAAIDAAREGVKVLEKLLAHNPYAMHNRILYCRILDNGGVALSKADMHDESVKFHRKAISSCPPQELNAQRHFNLATAEHLAGNYAKAEREYEHSLSFSNVDKKAVRTNMGYLYQNWALHVKEESRLSLFEKALKAYREVGAEKRALSMLTAIESLYANETRKEDDRKPNRLNKAPGEPVDFTVGVTEDRDALKVDVLLNGEQKQIHIRPNQHLSSALYPICRNIGMTIGDCFVLKKSITSIAHSKSFPLASSHAPDATLRILHVNEPHVSRYPTTQQMCLDFEILKEGYMHCMRFNYQDAQSYCTDVRPDRLCTGHKSFTRQGVYAVVFESRKILSENKISPEIHSSAVQFFEVAEPRMLNTFIGKDEKEQSVVVSFNITGFALGVDGYACVVLDGREKYCTSASDSTRGDPSHDFGTELSQIVTFRFGCGDNPSVIHEAFFFLTSTHRDTHVPYAIPTPSYFSYTDGSSDIAAYAASMPLLDDCMWLSPIEIQKHEWGVYSQNGEDGIIQHLLKSLRIGHYSPDASSSRGGGKYYVEFGVEDGHECNTRFLREAHGWGGLLMDGGFEDGTMNLKREKITTKNINELFEKYQVPLEFDLLVVDIDFFDFWVWKAIRLDYRPRIVIIEYNAHMPPPESKVVNLDDEDNQRWDTTTYYFGASLAALEKLGRARGYELVYCESHGVNAFFVRRDLLREALCDESEQFSVDTLYRKPNFFGKGWKYRTPKNPNKGWSIIHD